MALSAAIYNSSTVGAEANGTATLYSRDASMPLNSTIDMATDLGDLIYNQTQLDASSALSRANPQQFYKVSLSGGGGLKLNFTTEVVGPTARIQVLSTSGKLLADSSSFADSADYLSYVKANSNTGLDLDDGDYIVKVSYDATSIRSVDLTYNLALYSGTQFSSSYKTVAKPQTKETQALINDMTMTFSTIDAASFSTKATHLAGEDISSAIDIGWMYEDKSALKVTSLLTEAANEQYHSFTLQKGEHLKMAFRNQTDTDEMRVQLYDITGTVVLADSHGTDKQKEAYTKLTSEDGVEASPGVYVVKTSYAEGGRHSDQKYDFTLFSGKYYENLYETVIQAESVANALMAGRLTTGYSMQNATASYLTQIVEDDILSVLSMKI